MYVLRYNSRMASVVELLSATSGILCVHWWLPMWSSGQSYWLQIQRSGLNSWHYQIFWVVVGLEQSPPSLMSTIEELLEGKSSGSSLENQDYCHRYPPRWSRDTPLSAKVDTNFVDKRRSLGRYSFFTD
jgi:hypothetical protein